eukprot:evm.model.scf_985EXC.6 EVM.evm.TU.scf_985EXC.6   scf_985EXC:36019-36414(+)
MKCHIVNNTVTYFVCLHNYIVIASIANDLCPAKAIYREGGFSSVAARMGVDMNRKKHRQWGSMQEVVEELKAFMDASGSKDKGEAAHLPTRAQLEGAGRADLAYAVQKYGHCALSELAGMEPRKVGTHNRA